MAMNKQRRTSNLNNIVRYDTSGNVSLPAGLTVEGLDAGFVKSDANGLFSIDTGAYLPMPSQSGNAGKYLTTDGSVLSWGTVSTANIYNSDGTLTGNRTVALSSNTLTFTSSTTATGNNQTLSSFIIDPTFSVGAFTGTRRTALQIERGVFHKKYYTDTASSNLYIGSGYELYGDLHAQSGFTLYISGGQSDSWQAGWDLVVGSKTDRIITISSGGITINPGVAFNNGWSYGTLQTFATSPNIGFTFQEALGWNFVIRNGSGTERFKVWNSTGNVTLGGASDLGYKLDVQGTIRSTGDGLFNDITIGQTGGGRYIKWGLNDVWMISGTTNIANFSTSGVNVPNTLTAGGGTSISGGADISGYSRKLTFPAVVFHTQTHVLISQSDMNYGGNTTKPGNIWIYPGKNTTNSVFGDIHLSHDGTEARGRVAIGSSVAPTHTLDVTGTGRFTGALYSNTCVYATGTQSDGALNVSNPNTSGFSTVIINRADVTNCFGNISFMDRKTGANNRGFSIGIGMSGDPTWADGDFLFGNYTGTGGYNQSARIYNATGNWRIGATGSDSGFKLDVIGTVRLYPRGFINGGFEFTFNDVYNIMNANSHTYLSSNYTMMVGAGNNSFTFIGVNKDDNITPVLIGYNSWQSNISSASAILDVRSTTRGFLQPRMTTGQMNAISSPANGLTVFNTTDSSIYLYRNTTSGWKSLLTNESPMTLSGPDVLMIRNDTEFGYNKAIVISQNLAKTSGYAIGNILINTRSSFTNLTGGGNTVIGASAGNALTTGSSNVMIGSEAGKNVTTAGANTYIGGQSVGSLTNGNYQIQLTAGDQSFTEGVASDMFPTNQSYAFIGGGNYNNNQIKHFYFGAAPLLRESGYPDSNKDLFFYAPSAFMVTDKSGGNFTINAGRGTGTGTPGDVIIGTSTTTASGTTLQSLTNRVWIKGENGNVGIGASPNASYKLDVSGTGRFTNTLSVITTGTTNEVALFKSTEPYIFIEAAGASNSASLFFKPSTSSQNATIQNRTGGGLEFYTGATPSLNASLKASGAFVVSSTLGYNGVEDSVKSAVYTPTLTDVSNITSSSVSSNAFRYIRVGDIVYVSGRLTVSATTANTATEIEISLPIASNLANSIDLSGVATTPSNGYGQVIGDVTADTASFYVFPTSAGSSPWNVEFSYIIK
jgi:hypothetical protein